MERFGRRHRRRRVHCTLHAQRVHIVRRRIQCVQFLESIFQRSFSLYAAAAAVAEPADAAVIVGGFLVLFSVYWFAYIFYRFILP